MANNTAVRSLMFQSVWSRVARLVMLHVAQSEVIYCSNDTNWDPPIRNATSGYLCPYRDFVIASVALLWDFILFYLGSIVAEIL